MKQYQAIVCFLLLMGIAACTPPNQGSNNETPTTFTKSNSKYKYYVSAYTSGMVSARSPIVVRFANDMVGVDKIGSKDLDNLLHFEPAIKGQGYWTDRQTLRFTPDKWLPAGTYYKAQVNLKQVYPDINQSLANLDFDFKVLRQQFSVDLRGLREQSLTELDKMRLFGTVYTTDAALPQQVEEMLSIQQKGSTDFKVIWEHSGESRKHKFVIEGVKSSENASQLLLTWNGKSIGINKRIQSDTVQVPSTEFNVLDVKVIQEENEEDPYVLVLFSQPLQQTQNIDGLVSIENYKDRDYYDRSNFRYVIDGNALRVYPLRNIEGARKIQVSAGVRSISQSAIGEPTEWYVSFDAVKPGVRLVGNGVIVPKTDGLYFPFEAVRLKGVDIEVFKIYEENVLSFLQHNSINENYENHLDYVGRIVAQQHISLEDLNIESNVGQWVRYGINLDEIVKEEEGAIYQVRIGFSKKDALCECLSHEDGELALVDQELDRLENGEINSIYDKAGYYYRYDYEEYDKRNDPCYNIYYTRDRFRKRNILGSNLGLIAKYGKDKELFVAVTNLLTTKPIAGATIEVYDKLRQSIAKLTTDKDGIIRTKTDYRPEFVVASQDKQKGYLKVQEGYSLSMSTFETSGTNDFKGLKGEIYGERGVWRPGDSLYLTFVLEDKQNEFPEDHPVTFELHDPRGNLHQKLTTNRNLQGMYDFRTKTSSEASTGTWSARVHVGGTSFYKSIRIETVKPNRLKINFNLGKEKLVSTDANLEGALSVNWLHGAPASNIRTKIDVGLSATKTSFEGYKDYHFDDPARDNYKSAGFTVYDASLDKQGKASVRGKIELAQKPAGFMRAGFTIQAYEKSGDASTDNFSMPFSPYASYVGIKAPKGAYDKSLDLNVKNDIAVLVLDEDGKPLKNAKVALGVYKISWNWWWDRDKEVSNFNSSKHLGAIETGEVTTNDKGEAVWKFRPKEWGRYMIRVSDVASGHCSGLIFHAGSPWNDANFNDKRAASMLAFTADKESYEVGNEVTLEVPAGNEGRALLTLENGFAVLEHKWVTIKNKQGVQKITFKTTAAMAPTIYAHVTLLQPHQKVKNDLPLRSYGVLPIKVIDPKTKLEPILDMADVLAPNSKVSINVSEKNKQAMTYTIAMVDEGLLDLTRFKTPDLWEYFYKKEALGVQTWDMYNQVLGAFELNQILAIGGGSGLSDDGKKANRFKPVVRFIGPFHLEAGKDVEHLLDMPNYVGSVRTMLVAAEAGAYGKAEKTTPVREPLMVLGTLPRVLSPTEEVKLPVTVFAMEKEVKDVTIRVECNDLLKIKGSNTQSVRFDRIGDAILNFELVVADKLGVAKVKIFAESGKEKAMYEVELDVRNPNPYSNKVHQVVLDGGKSWEVGIEPIGMNGTNEARLEISTIPPIDLAKRLNYLIRYPYGCIEQTTSSVFPQLYVNNLIQLDAPRAKEIENNVRSAIKRLKEFQTGLGGFAYWPGGGQSSEWGSNYAGHFMIEAKKKGYAVPKGMLDHWMRYQQTLAKNWQPKAIVTSNSTTTGTTSRTGTYHYKQDALMQAYRLYTLALAQKPDLASMNKMRNAPNLPSKAKWRLAACYAMLGKKEVAKQLIKDLSTTVSAYTELSYTYGSSLRDEAMILETLTLLKEQQSAGNLLLHMSKQLSSEQWYATQTIAYSLMAIAKFAGDHKLEASVPFAYQIGALGTKDATLSKQPIVQYEIDVEQGNQRKIKVENKAKQPLFASVILSGQPKLDNTEASASNIALRVRYETMDGQKMDPTALKQGNNFVAFVEIEHKGLTGNYDEMALHQVFPAGWEIINTRMNDAFDNSGDSKMEYQNILDDRIYTYFDLPMGRTYTYKFYLSAAYQGKFYMPNVSCSAMYDNSIYANTAGKWVTVEAHDSAL